MNTDISGNYEEAIRANIAVHSAMADQYNEVEPHFRPESKERVGTILDTLIPEGGQVKVLDLGCGTGFMIDLVKSRASHIIGVDVTQPMLDKVDKSGPARVELINGDTGIVELPEDYFDLATAYTFLDHLYDMMPTFHNCHRALRRGGKFYADLSPNAYFWDAVKQLDPAAQHNPILSREVNAVRHKGEEIEAQFGVSSETFVKAEFQKHVEGGLREEAVRMQLMKAGFTDVTFVYHWFIGQAQLINDSGMTREERLSHAEVMHSYLTKAMPLSRHLFKYVGFIATK